MRAHAVWKGRGRLELDDGRGHALVTDLPKDEGGDDAGTSPSELSVLALAGCVLTIFPLVARRRRLPFTSMEIDLVGHRGPRAPTVERVEGTLRLGSDAPFEDAETALRITERTCPVGVLFGRAGVPLDIRLQLV
jgi:putative redox protein